MENENIIPAGYYQGFKLGTGPMFYGLFYLFKEHRKSLFKLLKHIFTDYFFQQLKRKPATFIDVSLDLEIQPMAGVVSTYFSFIPFLVGSLWFLKKEFKNKADQDIDNLITSLIDVYSSAGFIFDHAPTVFADRRSKGLPLQILHLLDRPRNYFPSLHVILVSYVYYRVGEIVNKYADDSRAYEATKRQMFNRATGIIESCILTKQHGIRDIAGGLAFVSGKEKEFGDTLVARFIESVFLEKSFGMEDGLIKRARLEIRNLYFDIMGRVDETDRNGYIINKGWLTMFIA